jgi:4-hydroxythreonine-4-phosphate dehydrogenase
MKEKILIVGGEPISINSEIIYKSWKKINKKLKKKIYLITNYKLFTKQLKSLNYKIKVKEVENINQNENDESLKIINVNLNFKNMSFLKDKYVRKFVNQSLNLAHNLGIKKDILGIINCPINKRHLNKKFNGATEYFASKCAIKNNSEAMLIYSNKLAVCPITTHIDIKSITKKLKSQLIINKIKTIDYCFKRLFKRRPKLAILGLNPHNAEFKNRSEEKRIIIPSIKKLKKSGINFKGPYSADSFFVENYKNYNVIVGMYHDQVITPFKTLLKFNAINVTLGLKYLRLSPDHGIAKDIIGKNKANSQSLIDCIKFINKYGK